jgi:peptidoglycan/LPS O-acetylase OafA/YrhL
MQRSNNYIPSLNGLRALSITIVLLYHLSATGLFSTGNLRFPFDIPFDGDFGVNVFFVISGFLITTLLMEEEKKYGAISLKNFYIRRVFRIFPAYYLLLLVYFVLQLFSVLHFSTQSWLSSLFYYKYVNHNEDVETAHLWSLSIEEQFYLVWPFVFLFFKKAKAYFAFVIILLVFSCRTIAYYKFSNASMLSDWLFIFQRADALMIGCLFALYREKLTTLLDKCMKWYFLPLLLLLIYLNSWSFHLWIKYHRPHLGFLIVPIGLTTPIGTITNLLIAVALLFSIRYKNRWFAFLNLPFMNFIGKLSYSLYLWQQLFLMSNKLGILNKFPFNIIGCFGAALLSYYWVERPFFRLREKWKITSRIAILPNPSISEIHFQK